MDSSVTRGKLSSIIKKIGLHEGNRHWSGRGCTENKRTAILSGLTIQGDLAHLLLRHVC